MDHLPGILADTHHADPGGRVRLNCAGPAYSAEDAGAARARLAE